MKTWNPLTKKNTIISKLEFIIVIIIYCYKQFPQPSPGIDIISAEMRGGWVVLLLRNKNPFIQNKSQNLPELH